MDAWFSQSKMTAKGESVLLKIAPRTAGGVSLYRNLRVDLALLSMHDRMRLDVAILLSEYWLEMDGALVRGFR
jgi:hypothetical protein